MRAEEARQLSDSKKETMEQIVKRIERNAALGYDSIISQNLHPDIMPELMRLGYKVEIHKDPINGIKSHIISW